MDQYSLTAILSLMLVAGPLASQPSQTPVTDAKELLRVTIHPSSLGQAIDEFAGQRVRIPSARIASVLDPHAFVIEAPSRYDLGRGYRDRTLVLIDGAALRVTEDQVAGSTVVVLGVATTVTASRLLAAPAWPASLDRERIDHLEIRGVVIATSVQTADGTELTR